MELTGPFEVDTPPKPVHRDDAIEMMKHCPRPICLDPKAARHIMEQSTNWEQDLRENPYNVFHHCQWFDFGKITGQTVREAAMDAEPFLREGFVRPPYPDTGFRVRVISDRPEDSAYGLEFVIAWENFNKNEIDKLVRQNTYNLPLEARLGFEEALNTRENFNRVYTFIANGNRLDLIATGMYYGKRWSSIEFASKKFNFYEGKKIDNRSAWIPAAVQLACWTMLNTKNINKRTVIPDEKLQKARAKKGKLPLAITTYIDSGQYEAAAKATYEMKAQAVSDRAGFDGEKRRSPRMHLRRAHLRTYKSDGHITPVAAMIVNADSDSVLRKEYRRPDHDKHV